MIIGGNRGLDLSLVKHYLAIPNTVVVVGVRNSAHPTSTELPTPLPKDASSSLTVVQIESASKLSALAAVETLGTKYDIDRLDIVIANAGIATAWPPVANASVEDMEEHCRVNVIGSVVLFQATLLLLSRAAITKFAVLSSSAGTLGDMEKRNFPNAVYGTTKAALNSISRKIHFENEKLVVLAIDPGWVRTEMGNVGAAALGLEAAEIEIDESIRGVTKVIEEATRESSSGRFWVFAGEESSGKGHGKTGQHSKFLLLHGSEVLVPVDVELEGVVV